MGLGSLCPDLKRRIIAASRQCPVNLATLHKASEGFHHHAQITHLNISVHLDKVETSRRVGSRGVWESTSVGSVEELKRLLSPHNMRSVRHLSLRTTAPRALGDLEADPLLFDCVTFVAQALSPYSRKWPLLRTLKVDFSMYAVLHLSGLKMEFPRLRRLVFFDDDPTELRKCVLADFVTLLDQMPNLVSTQLLSPTGIPATLRRRMVELRSLATYAPALTRLSVSSEFIHAVLADDKELKGLLRHLTHLEISLYRFPRYREFLLHLPALRLLRFRAVEGGRVLLSSGRLIALVAALMTNTASPPRYRIHGPAIYYRDWDKLLAAFPHFILKALADNDCFYLHLKDDNGQIHITGYFIHS